MLECSRKYTLSACTGDFSMPSVIGEKIAVEIACRDGGNWMALGG